MKVGLTRAVLSALISISVSHGAVYAGSAVDPPVPPGRDPGGTPVAVIGRGIDYTLPHLANMLARDGEGEIIGYDFADDDRRPFEVGDGTPVAEIVTGEGQAATLIIVRTDMSDTAAAGRAIKYAAETPAKIVLLSEPVSSRSQAELISAAAAHFTKQVFIVPVADAESGAQVMKLPNLIGVAALSPDGKADAGMLDADIATPVEVLETPDQGVATARASRAAARIAALAARLQAVEPGLPPGEIKQRILGLATPLPGGKDGPRILENPRRHFWLE